MVSVVLLNSATAAQSSHGQYINRCTCTSIKLYLLTQAVDPLDSWNVVCQPHVLDHKLAEGKSWVFPLTILTNKLAQ